MNIASYCIFNSCFFLDVLHTNVRIPTCYIGIDKRKGKNETDLEYIFIVRKFWLVEFAASSIWLLLLLLLLQMIQIPRCLGPRPIHPSIAIV